MIRTFSDFNQFSSAAQELGLDIDLQALTNLDVLFFKEQGNCLVLNVRDYGENQNNLLILSPKSNLAYTEKQFTSKDYKLFKQVMGQKYGESTVLSFLVLREVLINYSNRLESLMKEVDSFEMTPEFQKLDGVGRSLRKLIDKEDDFVDLLIKLEDRKVPQVETQHISYDYGVLRAKAQHTLDRSRNLASRFSSLRSEMEMRATYQLNKRIGRLIDVMKKLTAATVIMLLPGLMLGYFGVNLRLFVDKVPHAGLLALLIPLITAFSAVIVFKHKKWI